MKLSRRSALLATASLTLLCLLAFGASRRWRLQLVEHGIALAYADVQTVSPAQLVQRRAQDPGLLVLDTRSRAEYGLSHLEGARHVDPEHPNLTVLGAEHDAAIVVYCSVGVRSAELARLLHQAGYRRVWNLEGGIFAWANAGYPVYAQERKVSRVHPFSWAWGTLLAPPLRAELAP